MTNYFVSGPVKLSGEVGLQGAKNSALKHLFMPLLTNSKFTFHNIPNITSSTNSTLIVEAQGAQVEWEDRNTVSIDTTKVKKSKTISHELFFHTSGGVLLVPILVSKYGNLTIELPKKSKETGGDQIGRSLELVNKTLFKLGIKSTRSEGFIQYELMSDKAFNFSIPNRSFGVSVMCLFTSLLRKGVSKFSKPTKNKEFQDVLRLIGKMGGEVIWSDDEMVVNGGEKLKGVSFTNMYDRHDFITFLSAALCTESEISIRNVQYQKMGLDCLQEFIYQSGIKLKFDKRTNICHIFKNNLRDLKPVKLVASDFPNFVTEWQVLLSPLFALINGESDIVEGIFFNRMRHWEELGKFGAEYSYYNNSNFPSVKNNPRSVKVKGVSKLKNAKVLARDVRCGAACVIAALTANGKSEIMDKEDNIKRGYEDFVERFNKIGANIYEE